MADHETINPDGATVETVVPYTDVPEYREYEVSAEELPMFLQRLRDPQIAEMVLNVDLE